MSKIKSMIEKLDDDPKLVSIYIKMMNKIYSIIALTTIMSGLAPLCTEIYHIIIVIGVPLFLSIYQIFKLYKVIWDEYFPYILNDF